MARILILGIDPAVTERLRAARPADTVTVASRLDQVVAMSSLGDDIAVVGPLVGDPVQTAQQIRSAHPGVRLVIQTPAGVASDVAGIPDNVPLLGGAICCGQEAGAEALAEAVGAAAGRTDGEPATSRLLRDMASISNRAPVAGLLLDADGRILVHNLAGERILGRPSSAIVGTQLADVFVAQDEVRAYLRECLASGDDHPPSPRIFERAGDHPSGQFLELSASLGAGSDDGALVAVLVRDATAWVDLERARVEADATANTAQRRLVFLAEAGNQLSSLDYGDVLDRLARLVVPSFADWAAVHIVEEDGSITGATVAHELDRMYPAGDPLRFGVEDVIASSAAALYAEIPDDHEAAREFGLRSAIVVPLVARGRALGALTIATAESERRFDVEDMRLLEVLGRRAGLAIDNARLFRDVGEAEARFRALVHGIGAIFWQADPETLRVTFVSEQAVDLLGHLPERWTEGPGFWQGIVHPADREAVEESFRDAVRLACDQDIEYRLLTAAGRVVWVRDLVNVVLDERGMVRELRGLKVDVTERTTAAMRQEAERQIVRVLASAETVEEAASEILPAVADSLDWSAGAMWVVEEDGEHLRCIDFWRAPGLHAIAFEKVSREARFSPGIGLPGRVWQSGKSQWIENVVNEPNFPRAPVAALEGLRGAFGFPITGRNGVAGVIEFFSREVREPDVDLLSMTESVGSQIGQFMDRKGAEDRLRFQRALLESQNEATVDGTLVVSPDGRVLSYNRRFVEMFDLPESVVHEGSEEAALLAILDKLAEPDRMVQRGIHLMQHLEENAREEIALKDGRVFDLWSAALVSENGAPHGRAWYFRDITWRKRTEEALRRGRERFQLLADAGSALVSLDLDTMLQELASTIVPALGDWCAVDLVTVGGGFARAAKSGEGPALALDDTVTRVASTGVAELLREPVADAASSAMVVALQSRGRVLGTVSIVNGPDRREHARSDLALAEDLARRAGLAAENARLFREKSEVARVLQESLLPPVLPDLPFARTAARYEAAGEGFEVGGDFYDIFRIAGQTWAVVMGDVCGKGPEAAAVTALSRYTVRAAGMQSRRPSVVLRTLNEAILKQRTDRRFCTAAVATFSPDGDGARMVVALGGHPPPLILRASGAVERAGTAGTILGLYPDPSLRDETLRLGRGDTVLFYTDGLIEARCADVAFGEDGLRDAVAKCVGMDAKDLVAWVYQEIRSFSNSASRDDMALVAVRIEPPAA